MGNYYGSELNRFIGEHCPHDFTTINIDCLTLKWEAQTLRIIEAKHINEPLGNQQVKALQFLANNIVPREYCKQWKIEVCITRGNEPYDEILVLDLHTNQVFKITGVDNVIKWLSFRVNICDIAECLQDATPAFYTRLPF